MTKPNDFTITKAQNPEIYDRLGGSAPSIDPNRRPARLTDEEKAAWDLIRQTGYNTETAIEEAEKREENE
jgi:hypothetical protein